MTRNLKILGLALVATLAAGVLVVSGTPASSETPNLTAGKGTVGKHQDVQIDGSGQNETFHAFGVTVKCEITVFGPNTVTVPTAFFTVKPYHKVCSAPALGELVNDVTVVTNKCGFQFNIGSTAVDGGGKPIPDTYTGLLDFECENANEAFEVQLWFNEKEDGKNPPSCVIKLKPQTGAGLTIKVDTTGAHHDLSISGAISNLHAERIGNGAPVLCPNGTTNTAKYTFPTGGATLTAVGSEGELDMWID
ncbi:MAG: hypothetical protein WA687_01495 [Solirubrobacterales bacterium]